MQPNQPQQVPQTDPNVQPPAPQPAGFDFMLKDQPQPSKSLLPSSMGNPAKLLMLGVVILIVIVIAVSLLGNKKTNSQQVVDLMAQSREIARVTTLESLQLKDENVLNLASTTNAIMGSQQSDFVTYLAKTKTKYNAKELATHTNPSTDAQLLSAAQNSNLDNAYVLYLKTSLATYQASMRATFDATKSKSLKAALLSAYSSVATLLKSPQFNS